MPTTPEMIAFERIEQEIQQEICAAMLKALVVLGDNAKGVSWFCSTSDLYQPAEKAA